MTIKILSLRNLFLNSFLIRVNDYWDFFWRNLFLITAEWGFFPYVTKFEQFSVHHKRRANDIKTRKYEWTSEIETDEIYFSCREKIITIPEF